MKVIFDFDDVIFNAEGFKRAMVQVLEGSSYTDVMSTYEEYRRRDTQEQATPFSLKDFISEVDPELAPDAVEVLYKKILGFSENLANQEVLAMIEDIGKENCYIVTNGVKEFQMDKIRRSIGEEGFASISIVEGSKKDVIRTICEEHRDERVVFIDDKQKYFDDIDRDACNNLQTVLFDSVSGVARSKDAVNEASKREGKEMMFKMVPSSEVSRLVR